MSRKAKWRRFSLRRRLPTRACAPSAAHFSTRARSTSSLVIASTSGQAVHKGVAHPGEHEAIVSQPLWDRAHAVLAESPRKRACKVRAQTPALLKGLLFGPTGAAMLPTHTRNGGRLYRYYVSQSVLKQGRGACPIARVPAGEIEAAVIDPLRIMLGMPEVIVATWRAAKQSAADVTEAEVRDALHQLDPLRLTLETNARKFRHDDMAVLDLHSVGKAAISSNVQIAVSNAAYRRAPGSLSRSSS